MGLAFMKSDSNKDAFVVAQPADRLTVRLLPLPVLALAGFWSVLQPRSALRSSSLCDGPLTISSRLHDTYSPNTRTCPSCR